MSKRDDRLAELLSALDEGAQPESVLKGEGEASELASLINLAVSIRDLPHPELDRHTIQSEKRRLVSAARAKSRAKQTVRISNNGSFTGQWLVAPAIAGAALIILLVFVIAAGVGLYVAGPRGAQAAVLTDAVGLLEISDNGIGGDWHAVSSGDQVRTGQRIRTGDESWVTLEFFEGTQTTLAPNTDVVLDTIDGNWGNELQVELIQNRGVTNHEVIPLHGDQASYQVLTPSGEASVRGTTFKVLVEDSGESLYTVETGEVLVSKNGMETNVAAGQGVITELGAPLSSPSYLFTLQGVLEENKGKTWVVEGVDITKTDGTQIYGDPQVNEVVLVNGRITEENEWIAHSIETPFVAGKGGTFTGVVTSAGADGLEINGYRFTVGNDQPQVAVGDLVRVTFTIEGTDWVVVSLILLDGEQTPDDDDNGDNGEDLGPKLYFNPDADKVVACEAETDLSRTFKTFLNFTTTDKDITSIDVKLSSVIKEGDEFVGEVILRADGDEVAPEDVITVLLDTPMSIEVTVTLKPEFAKLPPQGEIKIQVVGTEAVEGEPLSAHFEAKWECDEDLSDQLFFDPGKEKVVDCEPVAESMRKFTTTLNYIPTAEDPQPLNVMLKLSDKSDGLEEGWLGSVTISMGGKVLDLNKPITLLPDESVKLVITVNLGAGFDRLPPESKLEIKVVAEGVLNGVTLSDTYKIKWECDEEIPEDELPDDTGKDGHYCTTNDEHPHAATLALEYSDLKEFGATYKNIMIWFCQYNLGFGEIELAFKLFREYQNEILLIPEINMIQDIIDMRLSGLGWGQIKHEMARLAKEASSLDVDEPAAKKEPPGKQKSEEAKNKEKPDKKKKKDE